MARLAAAFRANYEGQLDMYRLSERSFDAVIAREIADSKQSSASSYSSEFVESSTSSVASSVGITLPAQSRFLLLGTKQVIASGYFVPRDEYAVVSNVTVHFRSEVKNIKELYLVDKDGDSIATFSKDVFDPDELTWKANNENINRFVIPPTGSQLAVQALIKNIEEGHSEELIQVKWMSMNVTPLNDSSTSYQLIANNVSYPPHQTAMAHITSVINNRPPIIDLGNGDNVLLAEFTVTGEALGTAPLSVDNLTFTMHQNGVTVDKFVLGVLHDTVTMQCSLGQSTYINCQNIPAAMGYIKHDTVTFQLWGSVSVNPSVDTPFLQIDIDKPGIISTTISPGELGHLQWSDGTGNFRWLDLPAPLAEGSKW